MGANYVTRSSNNGQLRFLRYSILNANNLRNSPKQSLDPAFLLHDSTSAPTGSNYSEPDVKSRVYSRLTLFRAGQGKSGPHFTLLTLRTEPNLLQLIILRNLITRRLRGSFLQPTTAHRTLSSFVFFSIFAYIYIGCFLRVKYQTFLKPSISLTNRQTATARAA